MEGAPPPPPKSRRALLWTRTSYFGEGLPWSFLHQLATEFLTADRRLEHPDRLDVAVAPGGDLQVRLEPVRRSVRRLRTLGGRDGARCSGWGCWSSAASPRRQRLPLFWILLSVLAVFHATHDIACRWLVPEGARPSQPGAVFGRAHRRPSAQRCWSDRRCWWCSPTRPAGSMGFGACGLSMLAVGWSMPWCSRARPSDRDAADRARDRAAGSPDRGRLRAGLQVLSAQPQAPLVPVIHVPVSAGRHHDVRDVQADAARHRRRHSHIAGCSTGSASAAFIVASLLGGATIARLGFKRCLVPMTYVQNLAIPLYIALAVFAPPFPVVIAIVMVEQFASGIGNASHVVFLMRRSRATFSASHYRLRDGDRVPGQHLVGISVRPAQHQGRPSLVLHLRFSRQHPRPDPGLVRAARARSRRSAPAPAAPASRPLAAPR